MTANRLTDTLSLGLMQLDTDLTICYINPACQTMLSEHLSEINSQYPEFNLSQLDGGNLLETLMSAEHFEKLCEKRIQRINYATATFELKYHELEHGEVTGSVIEWTDLTTQLNAEREIQNLISGALTGNMNKRINLDGLEGFMKGLGQGFNMLMDSIQKPIQEILQLQVALSHGDLTKRINEFYLGEFGELKEATNQSVSNLSQMVAQVTEMSTEINNVTGTLIWGNDQLKQRSDEQSEALKEVTSNIDQLTQTVKQSADSSSQARILSNDNLAQAQNGMDIADAVIEAMSAISEVSYQIANTTTIIDEVAFQTNLLALNAAVEAARAGEHGRGFAVVAAEVRELSQRSSHAARDIKRLINDSMEKVEAGSILVNRSGASLDTIVDATKEVNAHIAEIAATNKEQHEQIESINHQIHYLKQSVQENQEMVQSVGEISSNLEQHANALDRQVGKFQVDENLIKSAKVSSSGQETDKNQENDDDGVDFFI